MKLVFATHNQNKVTEVKALLPKEIRLFSLSDFDCHEEIPETGDTLEENAWIKADYVCKNFGLPCFADDTGLLVDILDGAPGVYSARYAGPEKNAEANMAKLLQELDGKVNRSARFETVIALNLLNAKHTFKGEVKGTISIEKKGREGFGYDPIFIPKGHQKSFAEMSLAQKNALSHRGKAIEGLIKFLKGLSAN